MSDYGVLADFAQWENPRATALTFTATVLFIFAARYLPALRWSFKVLYMTLGGNRPIP